MKTAVSMIMIYNLFVIKTYFVFREGFCGGRALQVPKKYNVKKELSWQLLRYT